MAIGIGMSFSDKFSTDDQLYWEKESLSSENKIFLKNIGLCLILLIFIAILSYFEIEILPFLNEIPAIQKAAHLTKINSLLYLSNGAYFIPFMSAVISFDQNGYRRITAGLKNFSSVQKGLAFDYGVGTPLICFFFLFFFYFPIDLENPRLFGQHVFVLALSNFIFTCIFFGVILIFLSLLLWMLVVLIFYPFKILFN